MAGGIVMRASKEKIKDLGRLKKRSDFLRVKQEQRSWVSGSVIVQVGAFEAGKQRFGVVATKNLSKRAVDRNRVKRRLRAAAADILPAKAQSGLCFVLVGRAKTLSVPYDELLRDLRWCLKRMGCLKKAGAQDKLPGKPPEKLPAKPEDKPEDRKDTA